MHGKSARNRSNARKPTNNTGWLRSLHRKAASNNHEPMPTTSLKLNPGILLIPRVHEKIAIQRHSAARRRTESRISKKIAEPLKPDWEHMTMPVDIVPIRIEEMSNAAAAVLSLVTTSALEFISGWSRVSHRSVIVSLSRSAAMCSMKLK
jgi:hypothetical protein